MNAPLRSPVDARARTLGDPLATSRMGQLIAAALLALSRAARSVIFYDAGNSTVRQHLSEYQSTMRAALEAHGDIEIVVRPFQLTVDGDVVYQETDREKSLAFRLYRDGVRGLRIRADAPQEELLAFLEIAAVRYTGVRQQEEDAVTLLRKAEFQRISMEYVEGFTPDEELPEPPLDVALERAQRAVPPAGWDTPLQKLPRPGPLAYRPVPDEALAAFRAEQADDAADDLAVRVAGDLVREALRSNWPMPDRDLTAFFDELREGLLADRKLTSLRRLVDVLAQSGAVELRDVMLRGLASPRTLELVLGSIPDGDELPAEVVDFLPLLGLESILEQLVAGVSGALQPLLVKVVEARLPRDADAVLARLPQLAPALACELARAIVARAPERAMELARLLLQSDEEVLRIEGVAALEAAPAVPLRLVWEVLNDRSEPVRIRAIEVLGRRGDASLSERLRLRLEEARAASPDEAEALGRALAQVAPSAAAPLFACWLEPRARFLRGLTAQQRVQQWAAVAGTGVLPGDDTAALQALAERSDGDLRRHCLKVLARRRGSVHAAR